MRGSPDVISLDQATVFDISRTSGSATASSVLGSGQVGHGGRVSPGPGRTARPHRAGGRITATVRFFRGDFAVRKQLATTDGLIGYTLRARPLARDYWTLSVWNDNTALREFMRTPPYVQVMTSLKPYMGPTKFVTWTISAADGRPSMAGALDHLASG